MEKSCVICGKQFTAVRSLITCSIECSKQRNNQGNNKRAITYRKRSKVSKGCECCGKTFLGYPKTKTCSTKCRYILTGKNNKDKKWTEDMKKTQSMSRKGKSWEETYGLEKSREMKKKMSERMKGNIPHNKGIPLSDVTKQKISDYFSGRKKTEEHKRKIRDSNLKVAHIHRQRTIDFLKSGGMPNKETSIERMFKEELERQKINYEFQKPFDIGIADFFIPDKNIFIFCDGNYWHNYPNGKARDTKQVKYLQNKGYKAIRIWETDIKKDVAQIVEGIIT